MTLPNARTLVVVVAVLVTGCGAGIDLMSGSGEEVACSIVGSIRFPTSYLDGAEYDRAEFAATKIGGVLQAFFVGGEGEPENQQYLESDGFSVVSNSLVIGYQEDMPVTFFRLDGDDVNSWGGCQPTLVSRSLVAYRWQPVLPVEPDSSIVPIQVEGGGCVTDGETQVITEVESVDVIESSERVEITVWVRERFISACAGVGVMIDATADLSEPLGDRTLIDAGTIPATEHKAPKTRGEPGETCWSAAEAHSPTQMAVSPRRGSSKLACSLSDRTRSARGSSSDRSSRNKLACWSQTVT